MTVSQSQPISAPESAAREAENTAALKPSEVLERAAALIEPEGAWTQENWYVGDPDSPTCWCAEGAIAQAMGISPIFADRSTAADYLMRLVGRYSCVPEWNDAKERTQPEVVTALRKAAELARSEGQ